MEEQDLEDIKHTYTHYTDLYEKTKSKIKLWYKSWH